MNPSEVLINAGFKYFEFTVTRTGEVQIHKFDNVAKARRILDNAGFQSVGVYYSPLEKRGVYA